MDSLPAIRADNIEMDLGEAPLTPARSALYHLTPIARGTALRESLSSFMLRLADQHTINPGTLTFVPGIDPRCAGWKLGAVEARGARNVWTQSYLNGTSSVAMIWSSELARLTGHNRLDDLTLLALAQVVSVTGLVHATRKWCPQCLRDHERQGVPYGQLLWDIAAVEACPVHAIQLVSTCQCGGTGRPAPTAKRLPHICPYCCRRLTESQRSSQAPLGLFQRARVVADLLEHTDFDSGSWPADGFSRFLISAARLHFEGNLSRLASALGLNRATVYGWIREGRRPTLERVVTLAEVFGCPIRCVLQGDASYTQLRAAVSLGSRRQMSREIPPELRKRIPRQLHALQRRRKAISLSQAARELGVSRRFLRCHHRMACDTLVARFKEQRAIEAAERTERLLQLFRVRVKAIAASGINPTLARAMGRDSLRLIGLRHQCRQIIADTLRESWAESA